MTYAPLARIALRYLSGALVAYGLAAEGTDLAADPDMVAVAGMALAGVVEVVYVLAKRRGWST
ncbi:hypothetical protein ACRARG_04465 [Pseudooceanicola sp. C21-150M6]|uniref:hypothetical protein n=1 Tax=Pseudooceanicola sp. C21-150M6 TaxID=3434355 RepID=UPI003D7FC9A0